MVYKENDNKIYLFNLSITEFAIAVLLKTFSSDMQL